MTAKKAQAVAALVQGHSKQETAALVGVSTSTLRRWQSESDFREAYREATGAVLETTVRKLQTAALDAAGVLHSVAVDTDTAAGTRVQAADRILTHSAKLAEQLDVLDRLDALEAAIEGERD